VTDIHHEDNIQMIKDFGQLFNCRTESQNGMIKLTLPGAILKNS
jgi:hypothetical protein